MTLREKQIRRILADDNLSHETRQALMKVLMGILNSEFHHEIKEIEKSDKVKCLPYKISKGMNEMWTVKDENTGKYGVFLTQKKAFKFIVKLKNERNAKKILDNL